MKISVQNVLIGVGAGAVDEVLEHLDETADTPRTEAFTRWTDLGRIALTALGYLGQAMNIMPEFAAPLAQSEVTLLTKSVGKKLRESLTTSSSVAPTHSNVQIPASPGRRVAWKPKAVRA